MNILMMEVMKSVLNAIYFGKIHFNNIFWIVKNAKTKQLNVMLVILVKIDIMIVMIINVTVIKGTMKVTQLAKNAMKHGNILFLFALLVKNVPMEVPAVALIVMNQVSIVNYNLQPAFAK